MIVQEREAAVLLVDFGKFMTAQTDNLYCFREEFFENEKYRYPYAARVVLPRKSFLKFCLYCLIFKQTNFDKNISSAFPIANLVAIFSIFFVKSTPNVSFFPKKTIGILTHTNVSLNCTLISSR